MTEGYTGKIAASFDRLKPVQTSINPTEKKYIDAYSKLFNETKLFINKNRKG